MGLYKIRDFTDKTEIQLLELVKVSKKMHVRDITKYNDIIKKVGKVILFCEQGFFGILNIFVEYWDTIKIELNNQIGYLSNAYDILSLKEKNIKDAFSNVRIEDKRMGNFMLDIEENINMYNDLLKEMDFVIDGKNKAFNILNIRSKINTNISIYIDNILKEDSENIADNYRKASYIDQEVEINQRQIDSENWYNYIIRGWGDKERFISSEVRDLYNQVCGDSTNDSYLESRKKEGIKRTLDLYAEKNNDFTYAYNAAKKNINIIKNYKNVAEFVNSDIMKDKGLKKLIEKLGGAEKIWKWAKYAPETLEYIFTEYEKQREAFSLIKECYGDEIGYDKIINELYAEYNNKFLGLISKTNDIAFDALIKLGISGLTKLLGCGSLFSFVSASIDIVYNATGGSEWVKNYNKFEASSLNYKMFQGTFETYMKKIDSGKYTKEDIKNAKMAFEMLKSNMIVQYEAYRDMCTDPVEKAEIQKEIINIKNTYFDKELVHIAISGGGSMC